MFIFDFIVGDILDDALAWAHNEIMKFCLSFLSNINQMGTEIFELPWINAFLSYVSLVAWTLYVVGLVIAMFELSLEYSRGNADVKGFCLNSIKGLLVVSLFTVLPVELYKFSITLQSNLSLDILQTPISDQINLIISAPQFTTINTTSLAFLIMLLYAVIKVFFANLKRGGILLVLITLGVLHILSIPRSYTDAFVLWCKQIIALCFTAFMQTIMLALGLIIISDNIMLGIGLAMASVEVPRIAERYGMDTSVKTNFTSSMYAASTALNMTKALRAGVR